MRLHSGCNAHWDRPGSCNTPDLLFFVECRFEMGSADARRCLAAACDHGTRHIYVIRDLVSVVLACVCVDSADQIMQRAYVYVSNSIH